MDFITRAIVGESSSSSPDKRKCPPSPSYVAASTGGVSDGYNPEAKSYYPKHSPIKKHNSPPNYNNTPTKSPPPPPPPFYCNPSAFLGGYLNCGAARSMMNHHSGGGSANGSGKNCEMMSAPSPAQPMGGMRSSSSSLLPSKTNSAAATKAQQMFDYILVCDFEATCQENNFCFPNEIIEFPVVAIHLESNKIIGQFHSFVKPKKFGGKLTPFCTELTGITQEQVDAALGLEAVINKFNRWMNNVIPVGSRVIFATDGPTDMENFMYKHSVVRDGIEFPRVFYKYVDVRRSFASLFGVRPCGPKMMLSHLGLEFEGRLHSGLDDTKNIARIVMAMAHQGYFLKQNMLCCFEAFSVCELPCHRRLTGPASYPDKLVNMCRADRAVVCNSDVSSAANGTEEEQEESTPINEPEFPETDEVSSPKSLEREEEEEEVPFVLPNAAVDIVSPKGSTSGPPPPPPSPEPRKKFATHMRNKAKQQGVSCINGAKKKLSVHNVSKLPIADTLGEQQGLQQHLPVQQLDERPTTYTTAALTIKELEEEQTSTVATQSPGLTSNSSVALSNATTAPSSSQVSGAAGVLSKRNRRRIHKKKTLRVAPL